jgi:Rrf2 family iron-sulfur cluster assembly transcriptional regulator
MLSRASKYAITAILYLTNTASKENKKGAKYITEELNLSAPFLAKTLQRLVRKGIISSVKGPNGGFYLTKENEKNTIFNVMDCVDDSKKFNQCYLGQLECNEEKPCVVHDLYYPFKNELLMKLKTKTILEMAKEFKANNNIVENTNGN